MIDGADRHAAEGASFERLDPFTGKLATRAAAGSLADVEAAVAAAAAAFPAWSKTGPGERRALLIKAADVLASKVGEFTRLMIEETGATAPWAGFNVMLAANMLREAAAMTTQISGEIIPSDKPGTLAMGIRQAGRRLRRHRAMECAGHPRHPRRRHAARLRQHGGAQGLRNVPRHAPADRPGARRGRPARRA